MNKWLLTVLVKAYKLHKKEYNTELSAKKAAERIRKEGLVVKVDKRGEIHYPVNMIEYITVMKIRG